MIQDTTVDLNDRLQMIEDKLQSTHSRDDTLSAEEEDKGKQMKEEMLSTEQCIYICAELSTHISQVLSSPIKSVGEGGIGATVGSSERIIIDALQNYKERIISLSKSNITELTDLQEQRTRIAQCIKICTKAVDEAKARQVNIIEDISVDNDSSQLIVSTTGTLIWAKHVSSGSRSAQFVGKLEEETINLLVREESPRLLSGCSTNKQSSSGTV